MRSRASLLIVIATTGCMNEYHPEYHPVTTTTFVQNVSSPVTIDQGASSFRSQIEPKNTLIADAQAAMPRRHHVVVPPTQPSATNDATRPPLAPGTYLGPNVQIGAGVTFGGNVYVQGNLIIGGTREHPVLTTTQ